MRLPILVCLAVAACCTLPAAAEPPRIALTYSDEQMRVLESGKGDPLLLYREAIEENGGAVAAFAPSTATAELDAVMESLDGLLLPGGVDVDPAFYDEAPHEKLEEVDLPLDRLQFRLLTRAREARLPVLGICRGHQVLNVFHGGSLYQDIPAQYEPENGVPVVHRGRGARHDIAIEEGTHLHRLLGANRVNVNTHHHQAVKRPGEGLRVTARSDDGTVEAVEHEGDVFILGVQFHPERMREDIPAMNALFERLVRESRAAAARRCATSE